MFLCPSVAKKKDKYRLEKSITKSKKQMINRYCKMNRGLGCLLITQEKSENRIMDIRSDSDGVEHDVNEFLEKHAEEIEKLRKHCH